MRRWAYSTCQFVPPDWLVGCPTFAEWAVVERKLQSNSSLTTEPGVKLSDCAFFSPSSFVFPNTKRKEKAFAISTSSTPPCLSASLVDAASLQRLSSTSSPISICLGRTSVGREYLHFFSPQLLRRYRLIYIPQLIVHALLPGLHVAPITPYIDEVSSPVGG